MRKYESAPVRTTLDLPDELFRRLKAKAAMEGAKLKDLLTLYIERGLQQTHQTAAPLARRSRLPVINCRRNLTIPNLTPELQAKLEEEEDHAKLRRSFGR
jgi:hypothetical protein